MKTLDHLTEVVEYLKRKHPGVRGTMAQSGVYAMKFLRKENGDRLMFEEISGFRIIDCEIKKDTLIITQLASGYSFRNKFKQVMSSRLFLNDLMLINVYDHCAQFYSHSSIDFAYY